MSTVAPRQARCHIAAAGEDESRSREHVVTPRGWANVHRSADDDKAIAVARQEFVEVATELSEVETERIAAEQRLSTFEQVDRAERDRWDTRFRLEGVVENRRRDARAYSATELETEFEAVPRDFALLPAAAVLVVDSPPAPPASESNPAVYPLAAVRLADLPVPVILSCGRFSDAEVTADWLGASVARCSPSN